MTPADARPGADEIGAEIRRALASVGRTEPAPHTRTSTNGFGPDFCQECSEEVEEYVKWPCPAVGRTEPEGAGE